MIPEERRYKILEYIKEKRTASIPDVSNKFNVSEITVRRDLKKLFYQRLLKKIHGGAGIIDDFVSEPIFLQRINQNREEKRRIAQEAIKRISNDNTVLIESGSTCLEIVKLLPKNMNIKVITTAPHILNMLCDLERSGRFIGDILCCGGIWKKEPDIFIGPHAIDFFNGLKINIAFFGIVALSIKDGWMVPNIFEAELTKKILSCSENIIGVTYHDKFEKISFAQIGPLSIFDEIITDNGIDIQILERYKKSNLKLTTC